MKQISLKAIAFGLIALVSYGQNAVAADFKIRYGGQNIPSDIVSRGKDFGSKNGIEIKVDLFPSAGEASQALLAGKVDVTDASAARLIAIASAQPEKIVIISTHYYGGAMMSVATSTKATYRSVQDLKGKKVAAKLGTGSHSAFLKLIQQQGLAPSDFSFLNMNPPDMAVAAQQGIVDAVIFWEPFPSIAVEKKLVRRLTDFEGVVDNPHFYITTREYAQGHSEELVRFLAARRDLARFIKNDLDAAAAEMVKVQASRGVDVAPAVAKETLRRMTIDHRIEDRFFVELQETAEEIAKRGKLASVPNLRKLVDGSYLKKMQQTVAAEK